MSDRRRPLLIDGFLASSAKGPRLRVALLLDELSLPRPHALAVDFVRRCDFASIVAVVLRDEPPLRARASPLFGLYERWDRSRARAAAELLEDVGLGPALAGVPQLTVRPLRPPRGRGALERGPLLLAPDSVAQLEALDLDVVLRLGFEGLAGDALRVARSGVWSYAYGDGDRYAGGPAHYWELAERHPVSGVSLEMEGAPTGARLVLCRGFASTQAHDSGLSLARNRVKPALLGSTFVVAKLKELHERGLEALARRAEPAPPAARRGSPSSAHVASFLAPRVVGKVRARLSGAQETVWKIGVRVDGDPRFELARPFDLAGFRWIDAAPGRAYADPCLVEHGGDVYCFFEDIDLRDHRGRISCAQLDAEGRFRAVRSVLEMPYHLSYPLVFQDGGEWFMIPESRKNGTVDLFRAIEFPARWEKVRTLLDAPGLDTTMLRHDGRYWFFVTVREPPGASEQLLLFHADDLRGELQFHRGNPISTDIRTCRAAGPVFRHGQRLIRPSQDCSVTYGYRLGFQEITALTRDTYREQLAATAFPPTGVDGIHTYGRCGRFEVLDAKRMEPLGRRRGRARLGEADRLTAPREARPR